MKWGRPIAVTTLVCVALLLALAVTLLLQPSREPVVYRGRRLSSWIDQYQANFSINPDSCVEAQQAIQQIGTNAIPTLLDWLRYDEPPWRTSLQKFLNTRASAIPFQPRLLKLAMGAAGYRARYSASTGFEALGPAAHPAASDLVALFASKSRTVRVWAMNAFLHIQGQKPLILAAGLTNSESTIRLRAAQSIGLCFQHLGSISPTQPDMDFASAIPLLTNVLADPDISVRRAVTNTLRLIAPKELEKPGTPAPLVPNTAPDKVTNSVHR